jgi:fibronectin-binding autotransporter adhesin
MKFPKHFFSAIVALLFVAGINDASAVTLYWKGNGTNFDNGTGSWGPAGGGGWYWNPAGNDLVFEAAGGTPQILNNNTASWSSYTLKFASSAGDYTINGNPILLMGTTSIQNDSSSTQTINTVLSANNGAREINPVSGNLMIAGSNFYLGTGGGGEIRVWGNTGKTLTLNTVVSENGNLSIQENSTVILQKNNTYSGPTFIHAGVLQIENNASVGAGSINMGGTNLVSNSSQANALYLGANGSSGGINNTKAINVYSAGGTTTLGSLNTSGVNTNSGSLTLNRGITVDAASGGTLQFSGLISGNGGITKSGAGTVILTGANNYSGATAVNAGLLKILSGGAISSSTTVNNGGTFDVGGTAGSVQVNNGGLLKGSGSVGAFTLASGGTLTPGNSPGTLTAASAIVLGGSTYNWEIKALTGTAGTTWDLFSVGGLLDMSGVTSANKWNLVVTGDSGFAGWTDTSSYSYVFAQAASVTGFSSTVGTDVTSLFNITTAPGITSKPNSSFNPNGDFKVVVGSANGGTITTLNLMAVPEPSSGSMLLAGIGSLIVLRRFRKKA